MSERLRLPHDFNDRSTYLRVLSKEHTAAVGEMVTLYDDSDEDHWLELDGRVVQSRPARTNPAWTVLVIEPVGDYRQVAHV